MNAHDAARICKRIQETRQRITESDCAVRQTQIALADMRERIEQDRLQMAKFKEALDRWRTLDI